MKMKRLLALTMACAMVVVALSGCGGQAASKDAGAAGTTAAAEGAATAAAQPAANAAAPAGTQAAAAATTEPAKEPVKLVYYVKPTTDGNQQSDEAAMQKIHDMILADTGVDLEILWGSKNEEDHTTKLNLLLSSGQQVDIFEESWQPLHAKGFLADLTDYVASEPTAQEALALFRQETIEGVMVGGRMMAFPYNDAGSCYPVWLRSDLLAKCGLEQPKTIDELENVLRVFKEQDPVGNGQTMGLVTSAEGLRKAFMGGFTKNGDGRYLDTDGRIKPYFLDPGYKDFVQKMSDWYKDGLIAPETFSYVRSNIVEFIRKGQVASFAEWYSMVTLSYKQFKDAFPDGDYVYLDGLTGPAGLAESIWPLIRPALTSKVGSALCVSKTCKDVGAAVRVLAWGYLNDSYNFLTAYQGLEDVSWKWVDQSTKTYELIENPAQPYYGEYNMYMSLVNELSVNSLDPERLFHNAWLREGWYRYDKVKWSADKFTQYDNEALKNNVPNYVEIENYVQEEMIKFIIGSRPMSDWDKYMTTLTDMNVDRMVDELTRQYNELGQ
jgi:ABC-type glycerol-3-phosphate transport system substrate-binding protein